MPTYGCVLAAIIILPALTVTIFIKPFLFYVITPGLVLSGEEKAWGDLIAALYGEEVIKKVEPGS